jgi:hypothetical protein
MGKGVLSAIPYVGEVFKANGGMIGYAEGGEVDNSSFWNSHLNGAPPVLGQGSYNIQSPQSIPDLKLDDESKGGGGAPKANGMGGTMSNGIGGLPGFGAGGGQDIVGGGAEGLGGITSADAMALAPMAVGLPPMAKGGKVPAMVSPGERYLPPEEVEKVVKGKKSPLKAGEKIPGKAKYKGNDYRNDTVPKTLEEGGIVLPKSVMESKHPHWEAHKFVSAIMAKQGLKPGMKGKK